MPLPPAPPFSAGALTVPRQLNRWLDVNPQGGALTRTRGFIQLPQFTVNVTWLGYSDIVAAFNFEGPNNFSLQNSTAFPISPFYFLCIMWDDEEHNVHRYAMWKGVGEVIGFDVPLYSGQVIKKNFRFEVWSTSTSQMVISSIGIQFYTSVLGDQDYRWGNDFALVSTVGLVTNFNNINSGSFPLPTDTLDFHWLRSFGVAKDGSNNLITWTDNVGGINLTPTGNVIVDSNNTVSIFDASSFVTSDDISSANTLTTSVLCFSFFVGTPTTGTIYDDGGGNTIQYDSVTGKLSAFMGDGGGFVPETNVQYLVLLLSDSGTMKVYNLQTGAFLFSSVNSTNTSPPTNLILGNSEINIYEAFMYESTLTGVDLNTMLAYLFQTYATPLTLPLNFPQDSSPTPN